MAEIYLKSREVFYTDDEVVSKNDRSYEIGDRIGSGGNGAVYECINQDGIKYAIKFLLHFDTKSKNRFSQEVSLMQKLSNPHIVKYVDDGIAKVRRTKQENRKEDALFVIMEMADSNLLDYLKSNENIRYDIYVPQFRGLCEALKDIHQYAVHRDIKPENILIKGDTWILSDFGLCEFLDPKEHIDLTGANEKIGPVFWISPEAVNKYYFSRDNIGTYSDVYQMGMIFAFVLMKKYPGGVFLDEDSLNTTAAIKNVIMDSISNDYSKRPKNGEELLSKFNKATIGE